jgi:hypothetical protein
VSLGTGCGLGQHVGGPTVEANTAPCLLALRPEFNGKDSGFAGDGLEIQKLVRWALIPVGIAPTTLHVTLHASVRVKPATIPVHIHKSEPSVGSEPVERARMTRSGLVRNQSSIFYANW